MPSQTPAAGATLRREQSLLSLQHVLMICEASPAQTLSQHAVAPAPWHQQALLSELQHHSAMQ